MECETIESVNPRKTDDETVSCRANDRGINKKELLQNFVFTDRSSLPVRFLYIRT